MGGAAEGREEGSDQKPIYPNALLHKMAQPEALGKSHKQGSKVAASPRLNAL